MAQVEAQGSKDSTAGRSERRSRLHLSHHHHHHRLPVALWRRQLSRWKMRWQDDKRNGRITSASSFQAQRHCKGLTSISSQSQCSKLCPTTCTANALELPFKLWGRWGFKSEFLHVTRFFLPWALTLTVKQISPSLADHLPELNNHCNW